MRETAASPLDASVVLAVLRNAARAARASERPDQTLGAVVESLVPATADVAAILVPGEDGALQVLAQASSTPVDARHADAVSLPSGERQHPAAVAMRVGAPVVVLEGGAVSVVTHGNAPTGEFAVAALPLCHEGETVAALCLWRGVGRRYAAADLPLIEDLGERLALVLENVRLRREVLAARRAKSDFLAVMNHELRTPLTAVVGYADLMEAGIPGPVTSKQRLQLARIKESAWDLLELIDGILGYARYEGERPELHVRRVEPEALLRDALRVVEGTAEEKGLELSVMVEPGLAPFPTDPEKARRILFHLLSNAVKFTARGGVSTSVTADPKWVAFAISDTGAGIGVADRHAIFEPFWQGEPPETRTASGAGMGLSLAQKLVELLSGEIEVESEQGRGSTFTVRLPRQGPRPPLL